MPHLSARTHKATQKVNFPGVSQKNNAPLWTNFSHGGIFLIVNREGGGYSGPTAARFGIVFPLSL
jgi:hypothetical protein